MRRACVLLVLLAAACSKPPKEEPIERAPEPRASVSAGVAVAPPPVAAIPTASATASKSPAERYQANLAQSKKNIEQWGCSANKPVQIKPTAALITFRCPENTPLSAFDALSTEGFLLIDGAEPGQWPVGRGVQSMEFVKTENGGMMHRVRDGKVSGLVVEYGLWRLVAIPTGYRGGAMSSNTSVFVLADDRWVEEDSPPHHPAEGRLFGKDPVPLFPYDPLRLDLKVCRHPGAGCSVDTMVPVEPLEVFESWDGKAYATDLLELAPAYKARLALARAFIEALAATATPAPASSAALSASAAAPPASAAAPSASGSAAASSSAIVGAAPPNPYAGDDVPGCPLGILHAAVETFVYSRLLDDRSEQAMAAVDAVMATFPEKECQPLTHALPPWAKLRAELLSASAKPLSRHRSTP